MCPGHACRYFFSTCLSLWNKRLVGKEHGVLGLGPFPGTRYSVTRVAMLQRSAMLVDICHGIGGRTARHSLCHSLLRAAPMLITSVQFALQHLLARLAIATPWVAAPEDGLSWEDWWKKGAPAPRHLWWRARNAAVHTTQEAQVCAAHIHFRPHHPPWPRDAGC